MRLIGSRQKLVLALVVNIKARDSDIKCILLCNIVKLFKKIFFKEIVCVKENNVLTCCLCKSAVSGNRGAFVFLRNDLNSWVSSLYFTKNLN